MGQLFNAHLLATSPGFIGVVRAAVMKVAIDVFAEPAETPKHESRLALARTIFLEINDAAPRYVSSFVWLCTADSAIRTAGIVAGVAKADVIPDTDPIRVVQANWNAVAGEN